MSDGVGQFIPLILIGLVVWFFVVRSKAKKLDPRHQLDKLEKAKRDFASQTHNSIEADVDSFLYNFARSIRVCFDKYFVFEGKASKSEFWHFTLFMAGGWLLLFLVTNLLAYSIMPPDGAVIFLFSIPVIFVLAVTIPHLSVGARRLREAGISPWWMLLILTGIGTIVLLILFAQDSKNISSSPKKNVNKKTDFGDKLRELNQLYKEGVLTKEEFTKAKNKLLK